MANDIVAIAASIKIIVFISIDEKAAVRRASRKISYYDGLQFADAKRRELHAIFICVFALSLCRAVVAEQPLPPTAVVGFRSEAGVAKDRSPAANIDADCALIGLKEMPITPVDVKHHALEIARGKSSGLAVERAALIHDFERRQDPALLDIVEFDRFIWELDWNRRHVEINKKCLAVAHGTLSRQSFNYETPFRAATIANSFHYLPADNNIVVGRAGEYPRT